MKIIGRLGALILGLIGSVIAFLIDILYSAAHRAAAALGDSALDRSHFFIGLLLVLVGVVGSFIAIGAPTYATVLLLVAGIGLFFVIKGFAIFSIPFFLLAAILAYVDRSSSKTA
jgi:hypothetical protein